MTLHEQSTKDLERQVAHGSLSPKKEASAEAVLRHRRAERIAIGWVGILGWEPWSRCSVWCGSCCRHETNEPRRLSRPSGASHEYLNNLSEKRKSIANAAARKT
jgi:hypothetical protein